MTDYQPYPLKSHHVSRHLMLSKVWLTVDRLWLASAGRGLDPRSWGSGPL